MRWHKVLGNLFAYMGSPYQKNHAGAGDGSLGSTCAPARQITVPTENVTYR